MVDPLSIAASVVGLMGAAGKICGVLSKFINSTIDAPNSAAAALQDVEHMNLTLYSVQSLVESLDSVPASRKRLIQLDHLSIVITHSVLTISELESIICRDDGLMNRLRWVWNEKKILDLMPRLETQKSSLSLMIAVLQSKSQADANSNQVALLEKMDAVIKQNEVLAQRLEKLEGGTGSDMQSVKFSDDSSSIMSRRLSSLSLKRSSVSSLKSLTSLALKRQSITISSPSIVPKSGFEEELEQSRVYSRTQLNESDMSFTSSSAPSNAWSMLSGISLNDISVISAFRLPLTAKDIELLAPGSTFSVLLAEQMSTSEPVVASVEANSNRSRGRSGLYAPERIPQFDSGRSSPGLLASPLEGFQVKKKALNHLIQAYAYGKGATYTPKAFDNFIVEVKVGNLLTRLILYDTTGQETYSGLRESTYRGTNVFLILTKQKKLADCRYIKPIMEQTNTGEREMESQIPGDMAQRFNGYENIKSKWVPEIIDACPNTPFLVVGTHRNQPASDIIDSRCSPIGHTLARQTGARAYIECDVGDPAEARAIFNRAISVALGLDRLSSRLRVALGRGALKPETETQ
ncbi:cell division control 42 [Fusarium heterosporum]|uniref:Cell division control 42 n=1 Tax=Fusarium heterosporum TaxID=42747 RepID=A0A8H5T9U3_FUSHE|nr:cell division control 42 [Fusarium heterosporum]